ncbi:ATP-dependent DNA ligase [Actinoplanes xinjiangensis]|jgi:ATP-dependent DNA ligase|uniref:ATP-dependent DNA ligase n=1 Tax=Actinoplanes xinjiangensis TaxID=512350 RepID=A0A316EFT0_9ACTN|nr:ATP-dependent DNA ligase [Actinoplanes xinjiangensis]PWK30208.1 ATP-dependent DNA ligase [Actinoplanes xinjiangensis]GIF44636.1 ATP-dependent DNA ligase [Actinoplanes xinjiangensis]
MRAVPVRDLLDTRARGTVQFEVKNDGWRCLAFVRGSRIYLQSRQLRDLTHLYPDVVANLDAALLPDVVLDGEIVIWDPDAGRTCFPALQRRVTAGRDIQAEAHARPASYVVFDLLEFDGHELLDRPLIERRLLLEELLAGNPPGLALCPATRDPDEARDWFDTYHAAGCEGLVIKDLTSTYGAALPGWWKWKRRTVTKALVGGVLGTLANPVVLLLGRYTDRQVLHYVGRTVPLSAGQRAEIAGVLTAATDHPWRNPLPAAWTGRFDKREPQGYLPVEPVQVVDISVDEAWESGRWRHPVRFERLRGDLTAADVPASLRIHSVLPRRS